MSQQNADVLETLISQTRKNYDINPFLSKAPGVLGHFELFEPVHNLRHRGPSSRIYRGLTALLDQGGSLVDNFLAE